MKAAILGGTRGMGRALARRLVETGHEVFLLGRNPAELEKSAGDLEVRAGLTSGTIGCARCDLEAPASFGPALDAADRHLHGFDTLVITAGMFASQARLEEEPALAARLLDVNFTSTVLLCEEARRRLLARGGGTLCVFSSVAGERGRKPVVIYGAAKAGLSRYLEGLDHKYRAAGLRTITVKPGFVRTGMTADLDPPPFAGDPDDVAATVVRAIEHGTPVVYAPWPWAAVMSVIRRLPRFVMRRVSF